MDKEDDVQNLSTISGSILGLKTHLSYHFLKSISQNLHQKLVKSSNQIDGSKIFNILFTAVFRDPHNFFLDRQNIKYINNAYEKGAPMLGPFIQHLQITSYLQMTSYFFLSIKSRTSTREWPSKHFFVSFCKGPMPT